MVRRKPEASHLRNILVVGVPSLLGAGVSFSKGVVLARLLPVHEFGLGIILVAILSALDMFADAGIDRFIVQHRFGARADVMSTSHAYRVAGSTIVGLGIGLLSYPLAQLFKAPDLWPAIVAMGGVVVLRGLINLSYKLQQRAHRFESETFIDTFRLIADLAVTTTAALIWHSYVAAVIGAYANVLVHLLLSHFWMKASPYSFRPYGRLMPLIGRFSTPIYINATMLFAAMQGDRMVVAAMFSKQQLALYAVSCTVGQGLSTLISKVSERLLLPMMVSHGLSPAAQRRKINQIGLIMIGGSYVFLIGVASISPLMTRLIYGPFYHGLRPIIAAAAIFQMLQIQQSWLTSILIANGLTKALPLITMMRAAAFPAAILFVSLGLSLVAIPLAFAFGAAASLAVAFYATRRLRLIDGRIVVGVFTGVSLVIVAVAWLSATAKL
jgi:O-antigen/teichoic acid export membrane protein